MKLLIKSSPIQLSSLNISFSWLKILKRKNFLKFLNPFKLVYINKLHKQKNAEKTQKLFQHRKLA